LKQGFSVGPSARSAANITPLNQQKGEITVPSEMSIYKPRGARIGNGYTLGYRELMSLSRLRKAGVDTDTFFV